MHQGCTLLPFLFIMVLDFTMKQSTNEKDLGIKWKMESLLSDLDFADDIAWSEETLRKQQEAASNLENNGRKVGVKLSVEKTNNMNSGCDVNTDQKLWITNLLKM